MLLHRCPSTSWHPAALCGSHILTFTLLLGAKNRGRPYTTETPPEKGMWKENRHYYSWTELSLCSYMWMGNGGRWAAEAGAESTAPLSQCPLRTVLAGPALLMVCIQAPSLPQSPCKPVLQGPGAHTLGHSGAQLSGVTPWSGAPHWPHRGDPPALQMDINRHFCPKQPLQFAACPSHSHLHAYQHRQWL